MLESEDMWADIERWMLLSGQRAILQDAQKRLEARKADKYAVFVVGALPYRGALLVQWWHVRWHAESLLI